MTLDFVWGHYDTFFVLDHQSPLGDSERPSSAVHEHFLIQWQLNWKLDGLLCETMSCIWTECSALISLDVLEASTTADMLTTSPVILALSLSYHPASHSSEGQGMVGRREEGRGEIKAFHLCPQYGMPVESRLAWRRALSHSRKVPASDTLTPEPGTRSPASAEQTLYSAKWRKHNYIGPTACN